MVDTEEKLQKIIIRHKGIYDLTDIYRCMRTWFNNRSYDYNEKRYKDKVSGPKGNETEIELRAELKVNDFVQFYIDIDTHFYDVKEFPAQIDGETKMVNNGKMHIELSGKIAFDYSSNFKGTFNQKLLLFLLKTFNNYYAVKYVDKLQYELYDLQAKLKEVIGMETASNAY